MRALRLMMPYVGAVPEVGVGHESRGIVFDYSQILSALDPASTLHPALQARTTRALPISKRFDQKI
jgi:hypothetical protein